MTEVEDDTCRLCGIKSESEYLKYIFDDVTNLAQIINETLPIKVSQEDHSKHICVDCYNKIISHYDFIQSVLACSKEREINVSFFEVDRNEKLKNVVITKLNNDLIFNCPNCSKDLILLLKSNPEDSNHGFEISLAVLNEIEKTVEENSQISKDMIEIVDMHAEKSSMEDELHELDRGSINVEIDEDMKNCDKKQNINAINLQDDINYAHITLQEVEVLCESNKGTKRKFQESISTKTPTKVQKVQVESNVMDQDANGLNSDHDKSSISDLITFQSINNGTECLGEETENDKKENSTEYMQRKHYGKNLTESQTLVTKLDAKDENELNSDDGTSVADLMIFQPKKIEPTVKTEENDGTIYITERECINEGDANDSNIPKSKQVCNLCGAHYISQVKYEFHMERHKLKKMEKYVCLSCDKEFKNENFLWDHYLHMHKSPMRYICLGCYRTFLTKPNLDKHQNKHKHFGYREKLNVEKSEANNQNATKQKRRCTVCRKLIKDIDPNAINDLVTCASCEDSSACLMVDGETKLISQRQYHCAKCRKHFIRRERLEFHEMRHNENMDEFICSTCGKEFSGENSLYEHYLFVHKGARPHVCEVCGKSFQLKARLKEHHRKHTGEKPYQCEICGLRSMTSHALKFHKKSHLAIRHTCEICGKSFLKKQNWNEHLEKHWQKDGTIPLPQIFTCPLCNSDLPTFRMLRYHMIESHKLNHQDPLIMKQKPLYECNVCQEKFKHQMSLKAHKEKEHEGKVLPRIFQCDTCKADYKTKQMLINHIQRKHNGEKRYKCAQCNMRFVDIKSLYHHVLLHTGRKPFSCEYCNMTFRRRDARNDHRRKHMNNRPYQCTDCNKSFSSYTSRSNHRKKIHANNETECPECKEKCSDMQEVRIHLNRHLGEKLNELKST